MNTINIIYPYRLRMQGVFGQDIVSWVFDDPERGLHREAFVAGMDDMLDTLAGDCNMLAIRFSKHKFPGYQYELKRRGYAHGGFFYYCPELNAEGWLCGAARKYFLFHPRRLYIQVERIP